MGTVQLSNSTTITLVKAFVFNMHKQVKTDRT